LDPGLTTYSRRVLHSTYDVTGLLAGGKNVVGVTLGNGWYNPLPMRMWNRLNLREYLTVGRPRFIAQLNIEYDDGSWQTVTTDESWRVSEGPIIRNNIFLGEIYDARKEKPGWNAAGYDDNSWANAVRTDKPEGVLQAQQQPPIRVTRVIKPVDITQPQKGVYIFDMGQNFAGGVRLHVNGPAGTKIKLRYGELLYPDGTLNVYTSVAGQIKKGNKNSENGPPNLAYQSDVYILKGDGDEVYVPQFTFHGFRYVEITGYLGTPSPETIEGLRLNADVENAGSFLCSNQLFNRIQNMVRWTFLSNLFSVQSDCPHRERFGYGGDIVPTCTAFMLNFDMSAFYPKVVQDFADAARPNGGLTETAPYVGIGDNGFGEGTGPIGWIIAHPHLMDNLYRYYGNERIIRQQYDVSKQSFKVIQSHAKNNIIDFGISDHESIDPKPTALTGTAFYYDYARLLSVLAKIIGRDDDLALYAQQAEEIRNAFITTFLKPGTGQFDTHTQACQAFALHYNLLPENEQKAAFDVLVSEILDKHQGHLSTGIFGTKFVLEELSNRGRADIAYDIVNDRTFPGWGYMLENGATTLWEHWAFSDNTYSHNHPMFGSVSEWFFTTLAGIRPHPDAVGFDKIIIKPQITGNLTWVECSYNSIRGNIISNWRKENDVVKLKVSIPFNTTARVFIPANDIDHITENGVPAQQNKDITFLKMQDGAAVFEIGSGTYEFAVRQEIHSTPMEYK
ncbi:MAG: family 78 glycoside hydrolase catalytic domain, partial [Candidatus Latescibacteria bacterium]|nr:family 78 glycoside hydrolase catalytic domain [Candidatus Latescibacterota bacterium]